MDPKMTKPEEKSAPGKVTVPEMPDMGPLGAMEEEQPNVTPQEQKQYDTVVTKAMELLYADDRLPTLLDKLQKNTDNITSEIGHSAAMTLMTISKTVENQGQEIPEEILFSAGAEIVSQVTDIAVAAKLVPEEGSEKIAEAALYEGLRVWGQQMGQSGKINDERQLEAKSLLDQAGIQQDLSRIPGHGQQQQPAGPQAGAPQGAPQAAPQAAPMGAPMGGGIVNQAMGA